MLTRAQFTISDVSDGKDGATGNGIRNVINYYLASSQGSGITTSADGWSTDVQSLSSDKKYLWNYEEIEYTNDKANTTVPCVIGVYGDQGNGIAAVVNYYLATSSATDITHDTKGWTDAVQNISPEKKYLWNYEKITFTNGSQTSTDPCIIGAYGEDGEDGVSLEQIDVEYVASTSATAAPGEEADWQTMAPAWKNGQYIWSRTRVRLSGQCVYRYSDPVCITGGAGATGLGVLSITEQYCVSGSTTAAPAETSALWGSEVPTCTESEYIWTRSKITYTDGSITYSEPVVNSIWKSLITYTTAIAQESESIAATVTRVDNIETVTKAVKLDESGLHLTGYKSTDINAAKNRTELLLTEDSIQFKDASGNTCAEIGQHVIKIDNAEIVQTLVLGGGVLRVFSNGSMGFFKND